MRHRLEMLPCGPKWKFMTLSTAHSTKSPPVLYMRDPIECLQSIFGNPYFARAIDYVPYRVFKTAEKLTRVYHEWMSGNTAWEMQVGVTIFLPPFRDLS